MASLPWNRLRSAQYYELQPPAAQINYSTEFTSSNYQRGIPFFGDGQNGVHVRNSSSEVSFNHQKSPSPLGKPSVKKRVNTSDLVAAGASLICLVLAITAVANESISWRLGTGNDQLILLCFLLSIMNLSLNSVAPTLFLHLEARFGPSTLQNYDGIIRNRVLSSKLSFVWRLVLGLMLALPLALSVTYKNFSGGESIMKVDAATYVHNATFYGTFAPPGLQSLGEAIGVSLFSNATIPFVVATSSQNGSEPLLPVKAQAYGFNVLLLNDETTRMLDIPQTSYVSSVQGLLASGESWNITAPVKATVATFSKSKMPTANESYFTSFCEAAEDSSGAYTHSSMMNNWSIELLDRPSPGDQSLQYIGFTPDPGILDTVPCSDFAPYARPYDINRQLCQGTWSITRGSINLVEGSCDGTILPHK